MVSMLCGMAFGLVPAIQGARDAGLTGALKDARRIGPGGGRSRVYGVLLAAEMAMAVALLVGAGLSIRSFLHLVTIDPGFDARQSIALGLTLPDGTDPGTIARFYSGYVSSVRSHPAIESAGGVSLPPLGGGGFSGTFTINGSNRGGTLAMSVRAATAGYFETLRMPLVRGRAITDADHAGSEPVAVLSAEAARRFWPGEDPIGQRIGLQVGVGLPERDRRIVGIVADARTASLARSPAPLVYVPHAQYPTGGMTVFARARRGPEAAAAILREQLHAADATLAPTRVRAGEAFVESATAQPRFRAVLLGLFGTVAVTLAAIGLFGVTAFSVSQRRTEIGVRMALGADRASVMRLVLRHSAGPVIAGLAIGLAGAAVLARVFASLFFSVRPLDPLTFAGVAALMAAVAALATCIPASRAANLDPLTALRE
jgi:putative ABC transport system permease protein